MSVHPGSKDINALATLKYGLSVASIEELKPSSIV
eukprot:CAMPEP_0198464416 /NCGR_PEP_ID=MMETSP1456-20131121/2570_1 /TAXON_ID=1461544 ORGANISM="Unidentified sp., Strain RCC1871" /NCGR_SAMPLE_ID=MMETSP1456 /ASSEMBLY_ACC=CAM_ASM_001119 /LENGTH=34 /DNA_ID= /DNA_START= /DNA_END= /DNA_ORIENTATION=